MSSKRKSPPTKLDGSNGTADSKDVDVMPSAEIDLSIKSSSSDNESNNSEINRHNQLNGGSGGERMSGKVKRRGGDIQVREALTHKFGE
jgi:hypothetical protein